MTNEFKKRFSFEERQNKSLELRRKFPDRIPIIVEKSNNCNLESLEKSKFLVPQDFTVGQFNFTLRKLIKLTHEQAMFLYLNNGKTSKLLNTSDMLNLTYEINKDKDGFLYFTYTSENTFGL